MGRSLMYVGMPRVEQRSGAEPSVVNDVVTLEQAERCRDGAVSPPTMPLIKPSVFKFGVEEAYLSHH